MTTMAGRGARETAWAVLLVGGAVLGAQGARAASLCHPDEQIVFACEIKQAGKSVSVCIAGPSVAYRFGKPDALELQYPDNANDQGGTMGAASRFTREDGPFAGGVAHAISFEHQGVAYRVEDRERGARSASSTAWIEVTRGGKPLAHLDCLPGWTPNWSLLEGVVEAAPARTEADAPKRRVVTAGDAADSPAVPELPAQTQALPAQTPELPAETPAPLPPAKPRQPGEPLDCSENETARAGYPKRVTALFRAFAQGVDGLYAVAVGQFGPPQSCAVQAEPIDPSVQLENPDASSFSGTLRYTFPNGATLLYVNQTSLDETLTSLNGFTDENAARLGLEKAAHFALKKGKIEKANTDDAIAAPPEPRPAGSRTVIWSDDKVSLNEQNTYAEMTYLAKRLISLRAHK